MRNHSAKLDFRKNQKKLSEKRDAFCGKKSKSAILKLRSLFSILLMPRIVSIKSICSLTMFKTSLLNRHSKYKNWKMLVRETVMMFPLNSNSTHMRHTLIIIPSPTTNLTSNTSNTLTSNKHLTHHNSLISIAFEDPSIFQTWSKQGRLTADWEATNTLD